MLKGSPMSFFTADKASLGSIFKIINIPQFNFHLAVMAPGRRRDKKKSLVLSVYKLIPVMEIQLRHLPSARATTIELTALCE